MRFVTYNIHFGVGRDGHHDLDRIAASIDGADVIALQEVERFWPRSGMVDQPSELGKRLPEYWWVYGPNIDLHSPATFPGEGAARRRQFGNMILARLPILASENHPLPRLSEGRQSMRRGALEAVIGGESVPFRVISTHLCYLSASTRAAQVAELERRHDEAVRRGGAWTGEHPAGGGWHLGDEPEMPPSAVVLADFNFDPSSVEYRTTVGSDDSPFIDAWTLGGVGPGATKDGERIDQAWVTANLAARVRVAWVDGEAIGSDHQPVWFDIDV
jgi:endonuclease/exonuclease/phosphatase family metal-dependent hydrolase